MHLQIHFPKLANDDAWVHGRVQAHEIIALSPQLSVRESEINLDCKASVYGNLKFDLCQMMMQCSSHAQPIQFLSKMDELGLFGKVRSRGTTLMFNTFPFGAWNMNNFEVEVLKF